MSAPGILLTGATGLLGRYLLRDLLLAGRKVAVLVRDTPSAGGQQRIDELTAFWSKELGVSLPKPTVLAGNLTLPNLGLSRADRVWLSRQCKSLLHAAASIGFRAAADGEPWKTNVEGTRRLLQLCACAGMAEVHHVSTAFVCGDRTGTITEDEFDQGQGFHNEYERSKFEAERLLQSVPAMRVTVYRPSVIVGDSRTGFTSTYHGFYRFLDLADRLAGPLSQGRRALPLRFPFTGDELHNLVPVDWVAQAITRIIAGPRLHGRTYHLVSARPVAARRIKDVGQELLAIDGVTPTGPDGPANPTPLEQAFLDHLEEYWPYRHGDPAFCDRNTRDALPDLSAPEVDEAMLRRLIRFAVADHFGRGRRVRPRRSSAVDCTHYVEQFFPDAVRQSSLGEIPLDVAVGLDVSGPGGGQWTCRWVSGELQPIEPGLRESTEVVYQLDTATFAAVVAGLLLLQDAFFARRIEIVGNVEKGLKLAVLFGRFVQECPYRRPGPVRNRRRQKMLAPPAHDAVVVETVRIPSGLHTLEGELVYSEETSPTRAAVLAGPHPLLGGGMHNNVVRGLGDGLARRGLAVLRFDYRGAFAPQRLAEFWQTSHTADEQEYGHDLHAAVAFLLGAVGVKLSVALIGYSFGCSLLPGAVPAEVPIAFVLIAPTIGKHDLEAFTQLPQPKLVIAPHGDFAIDEKQLPGWFARLPEPKQLVRPSFDGHFFRGQEEDLALTVGAFLDRQWRDDHAA